MLQAPQHYDFATDNNIYRIRYDQFVDSLKVSEADRTAMKKQFDAEQNASQQMLKARGHGSKADTMRVYAKEAVTVTEREYYEQMAQAAIDANTEASVQAQLENSLQETLDDLKKQGY